MANEIDKMKVGLPNAELVSLADKIVQAYLRVGDHNY